MRRFLTAHAMLACLAIISALLVLERGTAAAADPLSLGLDRLKSAEATTQVEADELEYQDRRKIVLGRGNVRVRFGDRILYADAVRVNLETQEFVATGNVLLVDGPNRLEGDLLEFNYGANRGAMHNARGFLFPSTSFRGVEVRKVGDREFRILQGAYTTCRVCQPEGEAPDWEFRGEDATLVQDEFFAAKHLSVWVKDALPILYAPYFAVPLGPRRSGFLTPRLAYGNTNGFTYRQPFYWAISESQDALFTGTYRSKRGFELNGIYRYILSPRDFGEWSGGYIRDRKSSDNEENRWEIHGRHEQVFTPTLNLKADINFQSDSALQRDFVDRPLVARSLRTLQSNVFLTQAAAPYNAMLRADINRDLTQTQDTRLMRAPEFQFRLFERSAFQLPVTFGGFLSAAYFEVRNNPDTVRADFAPRLRVPWTPAPWLSLVGSAGFRETVYSQGAHGFSGLPSRTLFDAGGSAEARFLRAYDVGWRELSQVVHVVAPRVSYLYVPFVDQQRFPQNDVDDYISAQNHVTYGIENRFIARLRDEEGRTISREVLRLGVAQSLNLSPRTRVYSDDYLTALTPERVDNAVSSPVEILDPGTGAATGFSRAAERPLTNLVFSTQVNPHPLLILRSEVGVNTSTWEKESTSLQARFRYPGLGFLGLGYTNVIGQSLEAYTGNLGLSLTTELSLEYLNRYDARRNHFLEHNLAARYSSCCWEVVLRYVNRDRGSGQKQENNVTFFFDLKTGRTQQVTPSYIPPVIGTPGAPPEPGAPAPGPGAPAGAGPTRPAAPPPPTALERLDVGQVDALRTGR